MALERAEAARLASKKAFVGLGWCCGIGACFQEGLCGCLLLWHGSVLSGSKKACGYQALEIDRNVPQRVCIH